MINVRAYTSSSGEEATCGVVTLMSSSESTALDLNEVFGLEPHPYYVLTTAREPARAFIERSIHVISTSRVVRAVIEWGDASTALFSKEVLRSIEPFPSILSLEDAVRHLKAEAQLVRCFSFLELGVEPKRASTEDSREAQSRGPSDFETVGAVFTVSEGPLKPTIVVATPMDLTNESLSAMVNTCVQHINGNQPGDALAILRGIRSNGIEIGELLYLEAVAQVQLGSLRDAMQSLLFLLERHPTHQPARELLHHIRGQA